MSLPRRPKQTFRVEQLESRELLSSMTTPDARQAATALPMAVTAEVARSVGLRVVTSGSLNPLASLPDTGLRYEFNTSGRYLGLGQAYVSGHLTTPGFIASSTVTGTATIQTRRGSLSLNLSSAPVPGFSDIPSTLSFTATGGTGVFARYHSGQGTIQVTILSGGPHSRSSPTIPVRMVFSGRLS